MGQAAGQPGGSFFGFERLPPAAQRSADVAVPGEGQVVCGLPQSLIPRSGQNKESQRVGSEVSQGGVKNRWGLTQDAGNRWGQLGGGRWWKAPRQPCFHSESIFLASHLVYFKVQRFELEPERCHFPRDLHPPQDCFLKCKIHILIMNLCINVFSQYVLNTVSQALCAASTGNTEEP